MTDDKMLAYLRKVTAELQDTRERLDEVRARAREPIAVVGTACRFPGGVDSSAALWDLVAGGVDAMTAFPQDRGWDLEAFSAQAANPVGGFLDDAAGFDAGFFGISPREALAMDPQQRLALECCYEALEHAGLDVSRLRGSDTAVYLGTNGQDYPVLLGAMNSGADTEGHVATGNIASVLSGRVSYVLGLEGPAISVDTACSSSLVALHLAARALRAGECSLALVGGVTVMATPGAFIEFLRQGGLASDGRCKAFAETADGTGWGEGVGMLVLERLSEAQRNGRRILAVVRGSAMNSDGASNGLTAPNGPSQRRVIARALADADLKPAEVDVVEAHGTGTALGDPIEAQALLAGYGGERAEPLYLGSVKSNIGHTQAAAGVAGLIKMIEALRHAEIPRTLHVTEPTSHVDWSAGSVRLATEHRAWPETGRPRRAAVSSFGISGTNAHVIVEQAPETESDPIPTRPTDALVVWPVSGADPAAVTENLARLSAVDADPVDVGWTLATTRAQLAERAVVIGGSCGELLESAPVRGRRAAGEHRVGVVFSGQGAQRPGMGAALAARFPVFAAAFDEVLAEFDPEVRQALGDERVRWTEYAQPGLFAFEVAQYRLLESWGVRPTLLVGHSIGELTAAYLAGVWTLPDACRLVAARARLMGALPEGGAMVALTGTESAAREALTDGVSVAAVNGPAAVVISGVEAEVLAIADAWPGKTGRLRVSHAFHSALMEPMLEEFGDVARRLHYAEPRLPVISNLTGKLADRSTDPEYWVRHVREAVRFADGVSTLLDAGMDTFIEVGPRAALSGAVTEIAGERAVTVAPLGRDDDEVRAALSGAARLWVSGVDVAWAETFTGLDPRRAELPGYAFQRERFWPTAPTARVRDASTAGSTRTGHPLLGAAIGLADGGWLQSGRLARGTQPWLSDHAVLGAVLFPGTGFVELALRAGELVGCDTLEELTLAAPLILPEHGGIQLQVVLRDHDVRIYSGPEDAGSDGWTLHATGTLTDGESGDRAVPDDAAETGWAANWPPPGAEQIDVEGFYEAFAAGGFDYGPAFRGLAAAWRGPGDDGEVYVEVELPEQAGAAENFGIHPALLDVVLQSIGLLAQGGSRVPFAWAGVRLAATGARRIRARLRLREAGLDGGVGLSVVDAAGGLVLAAQRVTLREVSRAQLAPAGDGRTSALLKLDWTPLELPEVTEAIVTAAGVLLGEDAFGLSVSAPPPGEKPAFAVLTVAGGEPGEQLARVLGEVQRWLADESLAATRLVVVTRDAVVLEGDATSAEPDMDVAGAAVWGLIRSVASENPGRVTLIDADEASLPVWKAAVAAGAPQAALRGGRCWTPALARIPDDEAVNQPPRPINGPVLITGGTGGLGSLMARHLVAAHGVRELILLSRSGNAPELQQQLEEAGAHVRIAACDVTDRAALGKVIADAGELGAVIHTAGVLDDSTIEGLTPERLDRVLAPKLHGAELLDELTRGHELSHFIVFSSISGLVGTAGQGNYAAANTALDAGIQRRRAAGLPGTSLAWGPWSTSFGMTGGLSEADIARMRRGGVVPFTEATGAAALDLALRATPALVVPLLTAPPGSAVDVPPMLAGLVRPARRAAASAGIDLAPAERLRGLPADRRTEAVLAFVRAEVAAVLGHASADRVDPERLFSELGFDSLTAVELRNRLGALSGLRLAGTIVFDYPTVTALAGHLLEQFEPGGQSRSDEYRYVAASESATGRRSDAVSALGLGALYWQAAAAGREDEAMALITGLAAFRPMFAGTEDLADLPRPLPVSRATGSPALVCLPSFFGRSGPQEYFRLAARFQAQRPMSVLTEPGFRPGEPLPATLKDLVRVHAEILSSEVPDAPLILLGHSSGGLVAHALARHLEDDGRAPAGLILLDTFPPPTQGLTGFHWTGLLDAALDHNSHDVDDDAWLTAMAHYFLFDWQEIGETDVRTLQVSATAAIPGATDMAIASTPRWAFSRRTTAVDVPADHFSMLGEHVEGTAAVIDRWLTDLCDNPFSRS